MSRESDQNLSSINSQHTDHGSILTHDTEQFIIGQRVWVGGIRPGQIAYIGETHFAPGEWAGVVLDDPSGKNDGCVAGKRYFQCEPKRGIFSRLTRLTLAPLPLAQTPTSPLSKYSSDRSRTASPTASIRSSFLRSPGKNGLTVGDRVIVSSGFGSRPGILRYLGETQFASGNWCGVELDEPTGKNDGSVDGIRYFECKAKYGVFVPIAKVSLSPSSKKSRLSRTGSRESLTSIGTMNSIATTNTSRLRLNAQRKSLSLKPSAVTMPKSQFSMQELIREKQHHIEQLMMERDLDREDSQNTALQFQKNINELKSYIALLERQLTEERKKAEDLQFSIDEATFCGDELNAQTQVYKEKIHELESKLRDLASGAAVNLENYEVKVELSEQNQNFETKFVKQLEEVKQLQENIKYLKDNSESLQEELAVKDKSLEKLLLYESELENMLKELKCVQVEYEKEHEQMQSDFCIRLKDKSQEIQRLFQENDTFRKSLAIIETKRTKLNDEYECLNLHEESESQNSHKDGIKNQFAKITAELAIKNAECVTLDELVRSQQQCMAEEQAQLKEMSQEISQLKQDIAELNKTKQILETNLKKSKKELQNVSGLQKSIETQYKETLSQDQKKRATVINLETTIKELNLEYQTAKIENEELHKAIENLRSDLEKEKASKEVAIKTASENGSSLATCHKNMKIAEETIEKSKKKFEDCLKDHQKVITDKSNEIQSLKEELGNAQDKIAAIKNESLTTLEKMSAKISELESQNGIIEYDLKSSKNTIEEQRQKSIQKDELINSKISQLESSTEALESTSLLLEKLKSEHEANVNKTQELENELKQTKEQNAQHQLDLGNLSRKLESLNIKSDNLEIQNRNLEQEIISARTSSSNAHNEVKRLNEEIQNKHEEIFNLVSSRDRERIEVKGQLEELQQKLANSVKDFNDLKDVFHKAKEEIAQKTQKIAELEERTIQQELLLNDNQMHREKLQTKYESLITQNESLQQDLRTLRTSSVDSNGELFKLSEKILKQQKELEEITEKSNEERATLKSHLQASQQRIDAMYNQVETLKNELKTVTEESFNRFELLKLEQEKCGKQDLEIADLHRKLESFSIKYDSLEQQNKVLQNNLNILCQESAGSNEEIVKLTEDLTNKQKLLLQHKDEYVNERLILENQLQELKQSLQSKEIETKSLRSQLKAVEDAKKADVIEFETAKRELKAKAQTELQEFKDIESVKKQTIIKSLEDQLRCSEQSKTALDEAISSLQKQIQLLQAELLKSQLDFKAKEADMQNQIDTYKLKQEELHKNFEKSQSEGSTAVTSLKEENSRLLQNIQKLRKELTEKENSLVKFHNEDEKMRVIQLNAKSELELQLQKLKNANELTNADCDHKTQLIEEYKKKIDELKSMLESLKLSNEQISATNGELSKALSILEQEKCESANIFELFEMESDQKIEKLKGIIVGLEQKLATTLDQLRTKEIQIDSTDSDFKDPPVLLKEAQNTILELKIQLNKLQQANEELQKKFKNSEEKLKENEELHLQLEEYKKIIDRVDEISSKKSIQLQPLQINSALLQQENSKSIENEETFKIEYKSLQRKLQLMEMEKTKEIVALKQRIMSLESISKFKEIDASGDNSGLEQTLTADESMAQINFLNSIIVDMQRKNDSLKAKIETLEALPNDFTKPAAFELITKRKPAPRMFCDICDEFDKHETEDCPLQASDDRDYSPPPPQARDKKYNNDLANCKERKLPEPRKYCESCEVFGHEAGECDDECY